MVAISGTPVCKKFVLDYFFFYFYDHETMIAKENGGSADVDDDCGNHRIFDGFQKC